MRAMVLLQNIFSIFEIGIDVFVSNFRTEGFLLNRSLDRSAAKCAAMMLRQNLAATF
jgi:hypothetical protein